MKIIIVILLSIFNISCGDKGYRLSLEHQIYEFVFNEIMQDASKEIVIHSLVNASYLNGKSLGGLKSTYEELNGIPDELLQAVIDSSENTDPLDWSPILVNSQFVDVTAEFGEKSSDLKSFWSNFKEKYPQKGGYYYVSKVALSNNSQEAVVLFGYSCAVLCGAHDSLLYLKKTGNKWYYVKGARLWIS